MHAFARAAAASLAILVGTLVIARPVTGVASQPTPPASLPRIVVGFANAVHRAPPSAGATGSHYAGEAYRAAQSAQRQASSVAAAYSLREVASWPIKPLLMYCVVFEITNGRPVNEVLAALSKDARVVLAQPLHEFHTLTDSSFREAGYNDPLYDLQTNLVSLGIARAHLRTQGAGVHIALIDTGVDASHPDLRGRILRSHSFLPARAARASLRHGTAMAGLIAAVANNHIGIVGVAPLAELEVFEACWQLAVDDDAAVCNTLTLAQALAGALASGAPLVNLSIAGPADPLLTALVGEGVKRGVTFVAAVPGPDGGFPTAIPGVLSAGGSEHPLPQGALAAPAEHVLTLRPAGQYDFESGSSVAAAEVTGIIALLISASPTHLTPAAITSLLCERATTAATEAGDPPPIDVNAALARLQGGQRCASVSAH